MDSSRDLKIMLVLSVLFMALGVAVEFGGVHADVLLISPLLCLAVPLLGGAYFGEERLARLAARVAARRAPRRRASAASPRPRRAPALVVHGGRLIGTSLAVRPPPPLTV